MKLEMEDSNVNYKTLLKIHPSRSCVSGNVFQLDLKISLESNRVTRQTPYEIMYGRVRRKCLRVQLPNLTACSTMAALHMVPTGGKNKTLSFLDSSLFCL